MYEMARHFVAPLKLPQMLPKSSCIVTLGIQPTRPETGYGYIERGSRRPQDGVFDVSAFKEKPAADVAAEYVRAGHYYWNAGVFVARADTIMKELQIHQTRLHDGLVELAGFIGKKNYEEELERIYASLPSISIDYAVMENASDVAVVPVECGWSDVGSLATLEGVLPQDDNDNLVLGKAIAIDTRGCTLIAENDHMVATIGLTDMVVVHTDDATLVVPKNRAQDVREIVSLLEENR